MQPQWVPDAHDIRVGPKITDFAALVTAEPARNTPTTSTVAIVGGRHRRYLAGGVGLELGETAGGSSARGCRARSGFPGTRRRPGHPDGQFGRPAVIALARGRRAEGGFLVGINRQVGVRRAPFCVSRVSKLGRSGDRLPAIFRKQSSRSSPPRHIGAVLECLQVRTTAEGRGSTGSANSTVLVTADSYRFGGKEQAADITALRDGAQLARHPYVSQLKLKRSPTRPCLDGTRSPTPDSA